MAHHGPSPFGDELGATGEFPHGKLNNKDEGEIRIAIGLEKGRVLIDFGKQVYWIGFTPDQAREIAAMLIAKASDAEVEK